jgi:Heavy metal binding domain
MGEPQFETLRVDSELTAEHRSIDADIERPPDKVLGFAASMPLLYGEDVAPATAYACPMHPDVTSSEPGTCPKCGMQLLPVRSDEPPASYVCPMHPEVTSSEPGTCPKCGMKLVPADTLPRPTRSRRRRTFTTSTTNTNRATGSNGKT